MLRNCWIRCVLLIMVPTASSPIAAQTSAGREIVVSGTGSASFMPDRATLVVEVRTQGATPQEASSRNTPVMTALLAALRQIGHRPERLSTRGYTVQPTYKYDAGTQTVTGYAAFNAVTVRLEDVRRVGETLDAALAAGATRVGSVRFESSEYERLRRQALERAVAYARLDAEALARAAGGMLGDLISISTEPRATYEGGMAVAIAPAPVPYDETPINAGEHTIVASVVARWKFVER